MVRHKQSPISDIESKSSPISDTRSFANALRTARLNQQLSQAELAGKLGLRQRQISDLERATTDPRISTLQNVARALDLELMLIPRFLISAVDALQRSGSDLSRRPLYTLGDENTADAEDQRPPELGESGGEPKLPSLTRGKR